MLLRRYLLPVLISAAPLAAAGFEIVSVKRIWGEAPHSAFGDIIRFRDQWFCTFREGQTHAPSPTAAVDGKLRVISSKDGEMWKSNALIEEASVDLRDPHLSVTADGRLMIVAGGSRYPKGEYKGRQPRVMFSRDGSKWTKPQAVLEEGHWLWRVTWHNGKAYGISKYGSPGKEFPEKPRRQDLVTSSDGVHWTTIVELKVPGGDESTVRFLPDGRMAVLMRRSLTNRTSAYTGVSAPPYKEWKWSDTGGFVGGPNFIVLPDGSMVGGGRWAKDSGPVLGLGRMTVDSYKPEFELPSGGDCSYPGFVFHEGLLWTMYYSSHEGKTSIYLAKLRVK
jgi:hypothetical protein